MAKKLEKLPKLFKKKWLKALRSGDYKQNTEGFLKTKENTYCCLGIAAHICGTTNITNKGFIQKGYKIKNINKVPKLLHGNEGIPLKLAEKNDEGQSFKKIATWIEKYL